MGKLIATQTFGHGTAAGKVRFIAGRAYDDTDKLVKAAAKANPAMFKTPDEYFDRVETAVAVPGVPRGGVQRGRERVPEMTRQGRRFVRPEKPDPEDDSGDVAAEAPAKKAATAKR